MTRPAAITHPQKEENNEEKLSRYSWRSLSSGRNFYTIIIEGAEKENSPHFFSPQLANVWMSFVDGELAGAGAVVGAGVAAVHKVGGVLVGGLTARHDDCRRGAHSELFEGACRIWHLQTQQTPKPPAHGPLATPPRSRHSLAARQVPLSPETAPHSRFSKRTTEKSERTAKYMRFLLKPFLLPFPQYY